MQINRRRFIGAISAMVGGSVLADSPKPQLFSISLAQWSLHQAFGHDRPATRDPMDFAKIAQSEFDIGAVEYVNSFYKSKIGTPGLATELKKRADDSNVKNLLIMCDGEGALGHPDDSERRKAVDNHRKWLELAKHLGCHSIRVNAQSDKKLTPGEQARLAADGLRRLCEVGDTYGLNVIVENHGGLSSHGNWLANVIKMVDHKRAGTLPDFGNFTDYDRYKGIGEMMPFAKGVSAKSHEFDADGNETKTDYRRMMKIVLDAGYRGYVGIEYEGNKHSEPEGIRLTKRLLEKIRAERA